jgi:hypothetical protein
LRHCKVREESPLKSIAKPSREPASGNEHHEAETRQQKATPQEQQGKASSRNQASDRSGDKKRPRVVQSETAKISERGSDKQGSKQENERYIKINRVQRDERRRRRRSLTREGWPLRYVHAWAKNRIRARLGILALPAFCHRPTLPEVPPLASAGLPRLRAIRRSLDTNIKH